MTAPIVSATSLTQLGEILQAPQLKLTPADIAALDQCQRLDLLIDAAADIGVAVAGAAGP